MRAWRIPLCKEHASIITALLTSILPALLLNCWLWCRLQITQMPPPARCYDTGTIFNLKPMIILYNPQNYHSNVFLNGKMSWKWKLCTQTESHFLEHHLHPVLSSPDGPPSLFHFLLYFSQLKYFILFLCLWVFDRYFLYFVIRKKWM